MRVRLSAFLLIFLLTFTGLAPAGAQLLPNLAIQAPPELASADEQIQADGGRALQAAARLTGLAAADPGAFAAPIYVVLAPEGSSRARAAPSWVAGYAGGAAGDDTVVLFPARANRYPDNGLLPLLTHELTHVMVHRAAKGRAVPRWFNEGLAMAAGGESGLGDRARIALAVLRDGDLPLARLDRAFAGGETGVSSAYALAGDLVRELLAEHGDDAGARILAALGRGEPFEFAFRGVTGRRLSEFERTYWSERTFWDRWVPVISSSVLLWGAISFLAIAAFQRRRARDLARLARWGEEERAAAEALEPRSPFGPH